MGRGLSEVRRPGRSGGKRPLALSSKATARAPGWREQRTAPRVPAPGPHPRGLRPSTSFEPSPALGALATGCMLGSQTGRRAMSVDKRLPQDSSRRVVQSGCRPHLTHPRAVGAGGYF